MLRYWTAPSPTKTRETPHCLAKTLPFPLTPKAKSATTTTTTTLWVLWYIFSLNNKPIFYSYSDFCFCFVREITCEEHVLPPNFIYTCDTSRRYNPTAAKDPWFCKFYTPVLRSRRFGFITPIKRRRSIGCGQDKGKVEDSVYGGSFFYVCVAKEDELGRWSRWCICFKYMEASGIGRIWGKWHVPKSEKSIVWCDSSVSVEINDVVIEEEAWLRKKSDYNYINVAELDATIKGVNLALKWVLKEIEIWTDSVTVRSWIHSLITNEKGDRKKGGRIDYLAPFGDSEGNDGWVELKLSVVFVFSDRNKADSLTRVRKRWLKVKETPLQCAI